MKIRHLLGAMVLGSALLLLVLGALTMTTPTVQADSGILYAAKNCTGIPTPCYTSVQTAVNAASSGDTVRVLQGTYLETVLITKNLTLRRLEQERAQSRLGHLYHDDRCAARRISRSNRWQNYHHHRRLHPDRR